MSLLTGFFRRALLPLSLLVASLLLQSLFACSRAYAIGPSDLKDLLPPLETISAVPSNKVNAQYVDGLRQAANFKDYEVACHLFTHKGNSWKDFGQAQLSYKQKDLLRAIIKSSDYRDGSVVVKQADGTIRGRGGGLLRMMTMNIEPDSRTIRLPTGYSLASSDFLSLYDSLKTNLSRGHAASVSKTGLSVKLFKEPVLVLIVGTGAEANFKISEVVYLSTVTKLPVAWATFKDGQPSAIVLFDGLSPNKGLSEDLFHI